MDDVVIPVNGVQHWLWRAVNADGNVLLAQTRRNGKAAKRCLTRLIAQSALPGVVIADKVRGETKLIARRARGADHRARKGRNNRIEASHRPPRRPEKSWESSKHKGKPGVFLATLSLLHPATAAQWVNVILKPRHYRLTAKSCRHARADACTPWHDSACGITA